MAVSEHAAASRQPEGGPARRATADDPAQLAELTVEGVAHGGFCIARWPDGRAAFVRHCLPGERVRARLTEERARYVRADAVEILQGSPDRVTPPCPHAGPARCGGCDWQHASLPAQRDLKATVVREQLAHLAGLEVTVEVEAVPGAPDGLGWRTRVQYAVDRGGAVGLRRHRSREVERVETCPLAHEAVDGVGVSRRTWPDTAGVEVVAGVHTGDVAVIVEPRPGRSAAVPPLDRPTSVLTSDQRGNVRAGRGRPGVRERALGRTWRVSGSGFWQVHPAAAETLATAVLDMLAPRVGESALDLYCGVGLFAGALAPLLGPGGRVTAIERDPGACEDARHNLGDLGPQAARTSVLTGAVEDVLLATGIRRADLVVLDPPRSGAGAVVTRWIASLRPRAVAYVACDPAALGRDLATFDAEGYRLERLRAFDLFPMTQHVECLALLVAQE